MAFDVKPFMNGPQNDYSEIAAAKRVIAARHFRHRITRRSMGAVMADKYSAIETLRDEGRIKIRALTPDDSLTSSRQSPVPVQSQCAAVFLS
jgi:hypothetical protein